MLNNLSADTEILHTGAKGPATINSRWHDSESCRILAWFLNWFQNYFHLIPGAINVIRNHGNHFNWNSKTAAEDKKHKS